MRATVGVAPDAGEPAELEDLNPPEALVRLVIDEDIDVDFTIALEHGALQQQLLSKTVTHLRSIGFRKIVDHQALDLVFVAADGRELEGDEDVIQAGEPTQDQRKPDFFVYKNRDAWQRLAAGNHPGCIRAMLGWLYVSVYFVLGDLLAWLIPEMCIMLYVRFFKKDPLALDKDEFQNFTEKNVTVKEAPACACDDQDDLTYFKSVLFVVVVILLVAGIAYEQARKLAFGRIRELLRRS